MSKEKNESSAAAALQRIKAAEMKARQIVLEAKEKTGPKIIKDAYDEATRIRENHLAQARKNAEEEKKTIIQEASREAEKIKREGEEEALSLRQKAASHVPEAVSKVSEEVKLFLKGRAV